jgi:hypothetical protein
MQPAIRGGGQGEGKGGGRRQDGAHGDGPAGRIAGKAGDCDAAGERNPGAAAPACGLRQGAFACKGLPVRRAGREAPPGQPDSEDRRSQPPGP